MITELLFLGELYLNVIIRLLTHENITVLYFKKVQLGDYKALYKHDWVAGSIMSHLAGYGLEEQENCTTGVLTISKPDKSGVPW